MKQNHRVVFLGIIFSILLFARTAHASASVQINEIAWMGTSVSANAEWIELYNPSSTSVDLTGWKLDAIDGTPNINLSGSISGDGYFLLERTSDDTVPNIPANQIYTGALSNSGEHLQLIDNTGAIVDDVDASAGWPAGDDTTKDTMQWNGTTWITAAPTPDAANATVADTSTDNSNNNSSETSSNSNSQTTDDSDVQTNESNQVQNVSTNATSTPVSPDPDYSASVMIPDMGTSGVAVVMSCNVTEDNHPDMVTGKFLWSFGDGSSDTYLQNSPVNHVYYYPGTYAVTLTYYSSDIKTDPDYLFKKTITIIPAQNISISGITDDQGVILQNNGTNDIDLENWNVDSMGFEYVFPKYTTVPSGGNLYISSHVIGFPIQNNSTVTLSNPSDVLISKYQVQPQTVAAAVSNQDQEPNRVLGANEMNQDMPLVPFAVSNSPLANQNIVVQNPPASDFWNTRTSTILFIVALVAIILAYGAIRLYAVSNSDEFYNDDLLDIDDADDFL